MIKKVKVVIAEDQKLMRDGFKSMLKESNSFTVVGEASNGQEAIELLAQREPDIVILDISMPVMDGFQALPIIKNQFPKIKILIVSMHDEQTLICEMIKMGANGYITKFCTSEDFVKAMNAVAKTGIYLDDAISKAIFSELTESKNLLNALKNAKITELEIEILKLICCDKTNKEIAIHLSLTENNVEFHRKKIHEKTYSEGKAGLVKWAIRNGLIGLN